MRRRWQFQLTSLVWLIFFIGLALTAWLEHSRWMELRQTIDQLDPKPWIKIHDPAPLSTAHYSVKYGLNLLATVFCPTGAPDSPEAFAELLSQLDQPVITATGCYVLKKTGPYHIQLSGSMPIPRLKPGTYFIRFTLNDGTNQTQAVRFTD